MGLREWVTGRSNRATPTDTASVEQALARAQVAHREATAAGAVASGRWPRVERIIDLARSIREENHLADDIRIVLRGPPRG